MIDPASQIVHGGCLNRAVKEFAIDRELWLDLSTGINPQSYPLPSIPEAIWRNLPEGDDGLIAAATEYYACQQLIMTPGSQWSIGKIPHWCRVLGNKKSTVLVPKIGYQEHVSAWLKLGFKCQFYTDSPTDQQLRDCTAMVVINPNNPSGNRHKKTQLLDWHKTLAKFGAWLVVDEAFIDVDPSETMTSQVGLNGLLVLRSLGKFFGLAGARVGTLLAWPDLLALSQSELEPWAVSNPSRWAAKQAFFDKAWQHKMRAQLQMQSQWLENILNATFSVKTQGSELFQTVWLQGAEHIYQQLAKNGILVRLFNDYDCPGLRFGLPGSSADRERLTLALNQLDY